MPIPKVTEWNGYRNGYAAKNPDSHWMHEFAWFRIIPRWYNGVVGHSFYVRSSSDRDYDDNGSTIRTFDGTTQPFPVITDGPKKAIVKIGNGGRGTRRS